MTDHNRNEYTANRQLSATAKQRIIDLNGDQLELVDDDTDNNGDPLNHTGTFNRSFK